MLSEGDRVAFQGRKRETKGKALKKYWLSLWVSFALFWRRWGWLSFLVFLVSSGGMEGTAGRHKHHGSPIKDDQCSSISRLYVGGPGGVQSFLV